MVAEKKIRIAPQPADLRWAKGLVPTPHGNIEVAWRREGRRFSMRVNVPEGMTAEILPPTNGHASLVSLDGLEKRERLIQIGSGVHELKIQNRVVEFQEARGRSKREEDRLV